MTLLTPASLQPFSPSERPLTPDEARVLGTLMEKARTVPDSYPMTLNTLLAGCNQKTSRDPLVTLSEAQAQQALDSLKADQLVRESSGSRTTRYEHNFQRAVGVPEQSAVLLGLLMLRGPQTAGELRLNAERWYRFADISSVEGFLEELQDTRKPKAAHSPSNWHVRPVHGSSAGPTCCAGRLTPTPGLRPLPAAPPPACWSRVWSCWKRRWPNCAARCCGCVRSWGLNRHPCHNPDTAKRTTVLKIKIIWRQRYGFGIHP